MWGHIESGRREGGASRSTGGLVLRCQDPMNLESRSTRLGIYGGRAVGHKYDDSGVAGQPRGCGVCLPGCLRAPWLPLIHSPLVRHIRSQLFSAQPQARIKRGTEIAVKDTLTAFWRTGYLNMARGCPITLWMTQKR